MPLPKINHPIHDVYLKSLDRKVKFRPFLVKEEKLLLMAKEGGDFNEILRTVKQIISNCILEEVDVESLPIFDIEMFFINLRICSIGEKAEMTFTCTNTMQDLENKTVECGNKVEFQLNLNNIGFKDDKGHSPIIKLTDRVGIKLNYPSLSFDPSSLQDETDSYKFISQYLDYIYDENEVYKRKDMTDSDLKEFIEQLTVDQVKEITNFFSSMPKVALNQDIACKKCGYQHHLNVEGLLNFFD